MTIIEQHLQVIGQLLARGLNTNSQSETAQSALITETGVIRGVPDSAVPIILHIVGRVIRGVPDSAVPVTLHIVGQVSCGRGGAVTLTALVLEILNGHLQGGEGQGQSDGSSVAVADTFSQPLLQLRHIGSRIVAGSGAKVLLQSINPVRPGGGELQGEKFQTVLHSKVEAGDLRQERIQVTDRTLRGEGGEFLHLSGEFRQPWKKIKGYKCARPTGLEGYL